MAILKIAKMGHPALLASAGKITNPSAPDVLRLIEDMLETMEDAHGLGLAAPQVHVSKRLVIFHIPREEDIAPGDPELMILMNPVITPQSEDIISDWEGCLSVPGLRGLVPRYRQIRYQGIDHHGELIDRTASGLHARVVQHECDHLDGILYPYRMTNMHHLVFETEWHHQKKNSGAHLGDT